jgi:putative transcriptional regulator
MSDILESALEMAQGLQKVGMMDKVTFRKIEALCVPTAKKYTPEQIKMIREKTHTSRSVFAALLNVGTSTVEHWERGLKKPSGPSLRLLDVVERKGLEALC